MEIVQQEHKSGWQPRPAGPASAGRGLSVLVAVCAVLWLGWQLPGWYLSGTGDWHGQQSLQDALFYALLTAPLWSSYIVFRWATRPLWRAEAGEVELKRGFVLLLCLVFHLLQLLLSAFLLLLLLALL